MGASAYVPRELIPGVSLLCIGLSAAVSLLVIRLFLQDVLGAIIAAYVLHPVHRRFIPHLARLLSPIVLILGSLIVVILSLLYLVRAFIADLQQLARGETGLQIERIEATVLEYTGERSTSPNSSGCSSETCSRCCSGAQQTSLLRG